MGSTERITVRSGIFISRQVAFSARFLWGQHNAPWLFPVVPEVKHDGTERIRFRCIIKLPFIFFQQSPERKNCTGRPSSACMEIRYFSLGQRLSAISAASERDFVKRQELSRPPGPAAHTDSAAGRDASRGTATLAARPAIPK